MTNSCGRGKVPRLPLAAEVNCSAVIIHLLGRAVALVSVLPSYLAYSRDKCKNRS